MRTGSFSKYLDLALHTAIYSLNWIAGIVAGLLLLPIYSHELSVEDYGALDLAAQLTGFVRSAFASAFTYSVAKFFHGADTEAGKSEAIWTNAVSLSLVGLVACGIAIVFNDALTIALFRSADFRCFTFLTSLTLAVEFCSLGFSSQFLLEKKSLLFVGLSILRLFIAISLNLFFVIYMKLGGLGMLLGGLAASSAMMIVSIVICCRTFAFKYNFGLARRMLTVGYPMIPATFLAMFLHQGDRIFLNSFSGLESVGLFTMALQFPSQLNALLLTSFNQVWINNSLHDGRFRNGSGNELATTCSLFIGVYLVCQALLCYLVPVVFYLLVDSKFNLSMPQIPCIALAYCVHAMYIFLSSGGFESGRFLPLTMAYLVACFVKCALYLIWFEQLQLSPGFVMLISYVVFVVGCYFFYRNRDNRAIDYQVVMLQFLSFACITLVLQPHAGVEFSAWNAVSIVSWSGAMVILMFYPIGLRVLASKLTGPTVS
jgi:O-antigen/teichoic acid export membrane protein